jgi:hypothetical protein
MKTTNAWKIAAAKATPAIRKAYRTEIARLATELRPRFESGELRGFVDENDFDGWKPLLNLCWSHFRTTAEIALVGSVTWWWSSAVWGGGVIDWAAYAAAADVLNYARRKGWSKRRRGESPPSRRAA